MYSDEQIIELAKWFITEKTTLRKASKVYNLSKSTIHNYLTKNLKYINGDLYKEVNEILKINFNERSIRGGIATKNKFMQLKEKRW